MGTGFTHVLIFTSSSKRLLRLSRLPCRAGDD